MVCANLESLVAPHDETNFLRLFVFEESNITGTSFLPFGRFSKSEELGAPVLWMEVRGERGEQKSSISNLDSMNDSEVTVPQAL